MFNCQAHKKYALVSDNTIIRKCFSPYCHSLVRHFLVWLLLYETLYPFLQKGVEAAHKATRKDFNAMRAAGKTKAAINCLQVAELDRALQRTGRLAW